MAHRHVAYTCIGCGVFLQTCPCFQDDGIHWPAGRCVLCGGDGKARLHDGRWREPPQPGGNGFHILEAAWTACYDSPCLEVIIARVRQRHPRVNRRRIITAVSQLYQAHDLALADAETLRFRQGTSVYEGRHVATVKTAWRRRRGPGGRFI